MSDRMPPEEYAGRIDKLIAMTDTEILDSYADASLNRIMADTNSGELAWDQYWYDLRRVLTYRLRGGAGK